VSEFSLAGSTDELVDTPHLPRDPLTGLTFRRPLNAYPSLPTTGYQRPVLAVLTLLAGVLLMIQESTFRDVEAATSAGIIDRLGLENAHSIGSAVVFGVPDQQVGYALTLGCTAALLSLPLFAMTAGLLVVRRIPVRSAILALAAGCTLLFVTNQVRLAAIALGMQAWGAESGYARTHILAGAFVSVIGSLMAVVLYLKVLIVTADARELRRGK
jgi:exosortase/archaeosortase family protein